ncbi:sugar phosphate isomerase/epimerase family protein [Poritiphilus flavus]|uniref:TIM barrel protein n=1 Tax=Poritiphilus flavus TaxID=2697053 RepID=A0A6L9ECA6_9FLAO|nr:sugar phosphate isomerase/epimerase [Poritiphilus flavus]NAS12326.1 TIM barrel protein [Poritiphilus flavus]
MKRRVICLLFLLTASGLFAQEIGLQLYSLRNEFKKDVPGTFALIKDWGFTKVEDGNDGTQGYTMQEYLKLLSKYNLEIVSASASFEELEKTPETALKRAQAYGSIYLVCFWIPHEGTNFTAEDTNKAIEVFNKAGKLLKENGITLTYHPHGYEFRPHGDTSLMDHMIRSAKHFEFEMDVYWFAHAGEDPVEWLKRYPNRFKLMHLKDCRKGVKGNNTGQSDVETNVVLGTGQIDIAAVVAEAKRLGLEYLFIEDESSRVVEQVPVSLEFLKGLD